MVPAVCVHSLCELRTIYTSGFGPLHLAWAPNGITGALSNTSCRILASVRNKGPEHILTCSLPTWSAVYCPELPTVCRATADEAGGPTQSAVALLRWRNRTAATVGHGKDSCSSAPYKLSERGGDRGRAEHYGIMGGVRETCCSTTCNCLHVICGNTQVPIWKRNIL